MLQSLCAEELRNGLCSMLLHAGSELGQITTENQKEYGFDLHISGYRIAGRAKSLQKTATITLEDFSIKLKLLKELVLPIEITRIDEQSSFCVKFMIEELEKTKNYDFKYHKECSAPCRTCALEELVKRARESKRLYSGFAKYDRTSFVPILSLINNETYKKNDKLFCRAAFSGCAAGERGLAIMLLYQEHKKNTNIGEYIGWGLTHVDTLMCISQTSQKDKGTVIINGVFSYNNNDEYQWEQLKRKKEGREINENTYQELKSLIQNAEEDLLLEPLEQKIDMNWIFGKITSQQAQELKKMLNELTKQYLDKVNAKKRDDEKNMINIDKQFLRERNNSFWYVLFFQLRKEGASYYFPITRKFYFNSLEIDELLENISDENIYTDLIIQLFRNKSGRLKTEDITEEDRKMIRAKIFLAYGFYPSKADNLLTSDSKTQTKKNFQSVEQRSSLNLPNNNQNRTVTITSSEWENREEISKISTENDSINKANEIITIKSKQPTKFITTQPTERIELQLLKPALLKSDKNSLQSLTEQNQSSTIQEERQETLAQTEVNSDWKWVFAYCFGGENN